MAFNFENMKAKKVDKAREENAKQAILEAMEMVESAITAAYQAIENVDCPRNVSGYATRCKELLKTAFKGVSTGSFRNMDKGE